MPDSLLRSLFFALAAAALRAQQFDNGDAEDHVPALSAEPTFARSVDFDGDGRIDVVVAAYPGPLRLWRNTGAAFYVDDTAGRFPAVAATLAITGLAVGDVDRDGDADIVCALNGQLRRYRNDGAGFFADATSGAFPAIADSLRAMQLGDLDADGDLDLVAASFPAIPNPGRMVVLRNNGSGAFVLAGSYSSSTFTGAIELADFDGDSRLDCLLVGSGPVVWFGQANGTFAMTTLPSLGILNGGAVADLDGDGDLDLLFCGLLQPWYWLENLGSRSFAIRTVGAAEEGRVLGALDADADGDTDVVVGADDSTTEDALYLNGGSGGFTRSTAFDSGPASRTKALLVADLDGDARHDVLLLMAGSPRFYLNGGGVGLVPANRARLPLGHSDSPGVAVADFDGDGDRDLIALNETNYSWRDYHRNDGTGVFAAVPQSAPAWPRRGNAIAAADLDGDGDQDAGVVTSGATQYLINDGTAQFTLRTGPSLQATSLCIALADVDGDGDCDAFVGGSASRLELNDGLGTFTAAPPGRLPGLVDWVRSVAAGDVDGDGDTDFVGGCIGQDVLLRNNGAGTFAHDAIALPAETAATLTVVLADFDGDGDLDLFQANAAETGSSIDVLSWNDGTGRFTAAAPGTVPVGALATAGAVAGDVDGDGDADLVLGSAPNVQGVYRLLLNGGGTFVDATSRMPRPIWRGRPVGLVDLDRDDDLDLLVVEAYQGVTAHANLHRQLLAPRVAVRGRTFDLTVVARPGYRNGPGTAAIVVGWQLAPAPIPVPLLGTFFLEPSALQDLIPWVPLDAGTGAGTYTFTVPSEPTFIGFPFHAQALAFDASGVDAHLTGRTSDVVLW